MGFFTPKTRQHQTIFPMHYHLKEQQYSKKLLMGFMNFKPFSLFVPLMKIVLTLVDALVIYVILNLKFVRIMLMIIIIVSVVHGLVLNLNWMHIQTKQVGISNSLII